MSLYVLAYALKRMISIFGIAGLLEVINEKEGPRRPWRAPVFDPKLTFIGSVSAMAHAA